MNLARYIKQFMTDHYLSALIVLWTCLITASAAWNLYQDKHGTIAKAMIEARTIFQHNIAYRKWSTMHGGIYTKISKNDNSNPHFMFNMDSADSTKGFVVVDPFQMTQQAYQVLHEQSTSAAAISRSVSLNYQSTIDPYDEPDLWEEEALIYFQKEKDQEVSTVTTISGAPYLRLLKPYVIDRGCLTCHSKDDYKIGGVRGGMSVAIPMAPYYETAIKAQRTIFMTHMLLWLLGCIAIIKFSFAFKKYKQTITENEEKFRIVSEFAYNFEYWISQDNKLTFISPSCERLTGYSREEFISSPKLLLDIIHPEDLDSYRQHLGCIQDSEHEGTDFRIIRRDGEIRWFTHTCSPIYINDEFLGRRGSSIDITEHKNLENRLMQAKQLERMGQFAGGIAHDFNNVLSSIKTFTHLLGDEIQDNNQNAADYIKYIKIAAKLGKNLTSNLLSFGKRQIVKPQKTTLRKIINNIADILKTLVDKDIKYSFTLADTALEISADPHQIEQIIINLCTNARDAMHDGGEIKISTEIIDLPQGKKGSFESIPAGKYMALIVSDTGQGIAPDHLAKICEPFFTTKSAAKGTGLGLAIIHTIIKQHNAFIDVASILGEGTTFTIYFPGYALVQQDDAPALPVETSKTQTAEAVATNLEKKHLPSPAITPANNSPVLKTILLADDDELVRKSLQIPLEKEGYHVLPAEDGKQALSIFLDHQADIDLVILDVILPKRNGKEVYNVINKNRPNLNVIFISGYTDNIISQEMIAKEELNFMAKPVALQEFMNTVRRLINKT